MSSRGKLVTTGNISLPSTIPCNECRKPLPQSSYSAKRLKDLRNHVVKCAEENVRFDPKTMGFVRCSQCVGVAPVELKCNGCAVTFPRTTKYFSRIMMSKKDEALCWTCSQDQQNDTLSDSSGGGGSDGSDNSFVTNPYQYNDDDASTVSGVSKLTLTEESSSAARSSSGGVALPGLQSDRSGGSTIYRGPSTPSTSTAGSLRSTFHTTPSARQSNTPGSMNKTLSSAASVSSNSTWNPSKYGNPGARSATASVTSSYRGSKFAKVGAAPRTVDMAAARQQGRPVVTKAGVAEEDDLHVEDSSESDGEPVTMAMPGSSARGNAAGRRPVDLDSDDDDAPFNG